jgi:hypothetical protein
MLRSEIQAVLSQYEQLSPGSKVDTNNAEDVSADGGTAEKEQVPHSPSMAFSLGDGDDEN